VTLQRFVACAAALAVFAAMATTPPPTARAADGRELLANAIATTRGAYLVYNFGGGAPAPMLSAGGGWYEMSNGGHLMIIKSASQRLAPRLLVDSHSGYQARCERDPRVVEVHGMQFSAWRLRRQHPRAGSRQRSGDGNSRLRR